MKWEITELAGNMKHIAREEPIAPRRSFQFISIQFIIVIGTLHALQNLGWSVRDAEGDKHISITLAA